MPRHAPGRPGPTRRVVIDRVDPLLADPETSRCVFARCLAPLGFGEQDRGETVPVYGVDGSADVAFDPVGPGDTPTAGAHVAFVADAREAVDACR